MAATLQRSLIGLSITIALCCTTAATAHAQGTTIGVQISTEPADVCTNIPGVQATVPEGMIVDEAGNCSTPPTSTPPAPPACANLPPSPTIPSGYYRDANGNCYPQTSPPTDVCPNLSGLQVSVPTDLVVDANGNCIAPLVDACSNIEGLQPTIPKGMSRTDGTCFTPTPPAAPLATHQQKPNGTKNYKNVPAFLNPVVAPLVNLVPESVKAVLKTVPKSVAQTVPYYIYAILLLTVVIVASQAFREVAAVRTLALLLGHEKNIAEQKDNFIALASHYLHTPLSLMQNGVDLIESLKEKDTAVLAPMRATLATIDADIKSILADINNNQALLNIGPPPEGATHSKLKRSVLVWLPIAISLLLTLLANFLLGVVADVDLGTANLIFQGVVIVAVSGLFYTTIRNYYIRRANRQLQEKLIEYERTIDTARNTFITRSTDALRAGLSRIETSLGAIDDAPSAHFLREGHSRFTNILNKFTLLKSIRADGANNTELINLHETVDKILATYQTQITTKGISVTNDINNTITTKQNRQMFEFVIKSVIDNAIKFNVDGGNIIISANAATKELALTISDTGIGIPDDKLSQIFQPFARASSAIYFDYEGLGFSLFLDKIITDYMGGSIVASSEKDKGTSITVKAALASA